MLKLRILRWGDYPRVSRWVQCNHKRPENGKGQEDQGRRQLRKEGRRHRERGGQKLQEARGRTLPGGLQRGLQPWGP